MAETNPRHLIAFLEKYAIPTETFSGDLGRDVRDMEATGLESLLADLNDLFLANPSCRESVVTFLFAISNERQDIGKLLLLSSMYQTFTHSLLLDTSPSLLYLEVRLLAVLIPRTPGLFSPHIPLIMAILARAVCWQRRSNRETDPGGSVDPNKLMVGSSMMSIGSELLAGGRSPSPVPSTSLHWRVCSSSQAWQASSSIMASPALHDPTLKSLALSKAHPTPQGNTDSSPRATAILLLCVLYGFWPANILEFAKDPSGYLEKHQVESVYAQGWRDVWTSEVVRERLAPLLNEFAFNPSILLVDASSELDPTRYSKTDASEIVATADSLYIPNHSRAWETSTGLLSERPKLERPGGYQSYQSGDGSDDGFVRGRQISAEEMRGATRQPIQIGGYSGGNSAEMDGLRKEVERMSLELAHVSNLNTEYLQHVRTLYIRKQKDEQVADHIQTLYNLQRDQQANLAIMNRDLQEAYAERDRIKAANTKWTEEQRGKYDAIRKAQKGWEAERRALNNELDTLRARIEVRDGELSKLEKVKLKLDADYTVLLQEARHLDQYKEQIRLFQENQRLWDEDVRKYKSMKKSLSVMHSNQKQMEYMVVSVNREKKGLAESLRTLEEESNHLREQLLWMEDASSIRKVPEASPTRRPDLHLALQEALEEGRLEMEKLRQEKLDAEAQLEQLLFEKEKEVTGRSPLLRK